MAAIAASAPAAAARLVVTTTSAKCRLVAFSVDPGLKPNQPNQRMITPSWESGMLCPGMALGLPSRPYLPTLGPSSSSPAKAAVAPVRWTTVDPAKSCEPKCDISQPPPNNQWLIIGQMKPLKGTAKRM